MTFFPVEMPSEKTVYIASKRQRLICWGRHWSCRGEIHSSQLQIWTFNESGLTFLFKNFSQVRRSQYTWAKGQDWFLDIGVVRDKIASYFGVSMGLSCAFQNVFVFLSQVRSTCTKLITRPCCRTAIVWCDWFYGMLLGYDWLKQHVSDRLESALSSQGELLTSQSVSLASRLCCGVSMQCARMALADLAFGNSAETSLTMLGREKHKRKRR